METSDREFFIKGRVQGVGFRWWTRRTADALGVVGTVENLPDGSVRVAARADEATMRVFADKLREGPGMAQVTEIVEEPAELPEGLDAFTIERG